LLGFSGTAEAAPYPKRFSGLTQDDFVFDPNRFARPDLKTSILIGVISDTHGLLRPEALAALRGSEHIIHAGDVGAPEILDGLAAIAPIHAVCGNIDKGAWARRLPETDVVEFGGISIYVLHDLAQLDLKPEAAGFRVVIYGHSHVPKQEMRGGVLYFNPGSAGPRRFKLPVTVGRLTLEGETARAEIVKILD
jgi:putative phosphoesterase